MATAEFATEAQTGFISSLLRERETEQLNEVQRRWLESADFARLTKDQASRVITTLKELPRQAPASIVKPVPDGRYAVEDPRSGELRFYHVDSPEEGRWRGFTFVSVRASDELYPIRDKAYRAEILAKITEDPKEAMLRFGRELGACGHCGRTLTNPESRERGIGPVCRGRMGW